ncbi:MAG TPA: lytic murein transglycosylase [bacterium]|nr:lytic murein transglycosylase [bacterium]
MGGQRARAAALALTGAVLGLMLAHPAWADPAAGTGFTHQELEPLLAALEADGFPRATLQPIFFDPRLHRVERAVAYNVLNPDSANLYEQFVSPFAIRLAVRYKRHHLGTLNALQRQYGVPPNIVVGILLVETQFGTAELRYRLLEVFTSLIVAASPDAIDAQYQRMKADYPALEREWLVERLTKKAAWAYEELKALLTIRDRLRVGSLYDVMGSYAGAFGMPQFVPTSYARWAIDGNRDQQVDLDNAQDAMASIANFLYQHGWRADAPRAQRLQAVWEYNRSPHYVQAVFEIAERMDRPNRRNRMTELPPLIAEIRKEGPVPQAASTEQGIAPATEPALVATASGASLPGAVLPQPAQGTAIAPLPVGPLARAAGQPAGMDAAAP